MNLLIKPYWILGIDRGVQNSVGAENYGLYVILFDFSFIPSILLDIGITNFNNKNIAQNNHLVTKHFSNIMALKLLLGIVYFIVCFTVGYWSGYDKQAMHLLYFLGINQFLIYFIIYLRSNLAGLHLFSIDSVVSVLDRSIMIILASCLLHIPFFQPYFSIEAFLYVQTIAYFLTACITTVLVAKKAKFRKLNWNFPFFIVILKKSFPYAILVLLMTLYNRLDKVMMGHLLPNKEGEFQSGIYAYAFRILEAANMIAFLFAGLLLPIFSRMIAQKESVEQLVKLSYTLLFTAASTVSILCFFFSADIMQLLYKEHTDLSAEVFQFLMFCFTAISMTYIFGTLLTAKGEMKLLNGMAIGGILINISLNLILIPIYKAKGAAISSLVTQYVTAIAQIILATWVFKFRINKKLLVRTFLFVAGLASFCYGVKMLSFPVIVTSIPFLIPFTLCTLFALIWSIAVGLIKIRAMLRILKYGWN